MKRIGITGGMGCGKTTVVTEFERLGVPAFVADKVGGAYYDDASFLAEVHNALGDGVLDAEGRVDKKRIAAIVFSDKEALAKLNALVHPRVMVDFDAFCRQHADKTYVLFESAILYDYGLERYMDKVICVYLSLDERLVFAHLVDVFGTEVNEDRSQTLAAVVGVDEFPVQLFQLLIQRHLMVVSCCQLFVQIGQLPVVVSQFFPPG